MGDYQGAEALSELANDTNNCETETELQALAVSLAEAKETEPSNQHFVATVPHPSYRNEKYCSFFSALASNYQSSSGMYLPYRQRYFP
ncbi:MULTISPECIES: hypothetical protein [Brucella/Ochrobactrum group]|uniref:hypothetical protein n=1 Tax=Brucella/Ochrobactrum group TaxID=2826938 RepID=UPI001C042C6C|nr:hypothetical protein [Brucella sp. NBRC 12950]QWK80584.1 hypothetical protein KMS41_22945 [Ochrobactrum sp. BTU1]GLU27884.1 hypothetical protein Brsp01_31170 [Brucella sp. NBRC 12950]